jgi:hypothetical protein
MTCDIQSLPKSAVIAAKLAMEVDVGGVLLF